jgi:hypothetical protein
MRANDRPKSLERLQLLGSQVWEPPSLQETGRLLTARLGLDGVLRPQMAEAHNYCQAEAVSVAFLDEKPAQWTSTLLTSGRTTHPVTLSLPREVQ